jgi:hypothetical protein
MTTVCSNAIPVRTMLDLAASSIVFLIVTLAVPYTAAGIVGGTVGLALNHAFEAAYVAQTIVRPITGALQTGFSRIVLSGANRAPFENQGSGSTPAGNLVRETKHLISPSSGQNRPIAPTATPQKASVAQTSPTARAPKNQATDRLRTHPTSTGLV